MQKNKKAVELLVDIKSIEIDTSLPKEQRIKKFIQDIKNPYCFKVGDITVRTAFLPNSPKLEERMKDYFNAL